MTKETRDVQCKTYTVAEFAKLVGIGRNQAYEAVRTKQVPAIRYGKRILIPAASLDRILNGSQA